MKNKGKIKIIIIMITLLLTIQLIGPSRGHGASQNTSNFDIYIDGKLVLLNEYLGFPELINSRTMVPIRVISEDMGYDVGWEDATRKVTITDRDTKVEFNIGNSFAFVNGIRKNMDIQNGKIVDTKAYIKNERTMVPLRFITEAFGAEVGYEQVNGRHIITITRLTPLPDPVEIGRRGVYSGVDFDYKEDVYEDGRMTHEKTIEFLDVVLANVKVTKEGSKYYLKYDKVDVPEGWVVGIGLNTNFNRITTDVGYGLTTSKALFPHNQLPSTDKSFVFELDPDRMTDINFYNLSLTIASRSYVGTSTGSTSMYYIRYYPPGTKSYNGVHAEINIHDKGGYTGKAMPFDKDLVFEGL